MLAYRSSLFRSLKKEVSEKLPQYHRYHSTLRGGWRSNLPYGGVWANCGAVQKYDADRVAGACMRAVDSNLYRHWGDRPGRDT